MNTFYDAETYSLSAAKAKTSNKNKGEERKCKLAETKGGKVET